VFFHQLELTLQLQFTCGQSGMVMVGQLQLGQIGQLLSHTVDKFPQAKFVFTELFKYPP